MKVSEATSLVAPYLSYQVSGLNPDTMYSMSLHFELNRRHEFRYREGNWLPYGMPTKHGSSKQVRHERGVLSGKDWMKDEISFQSVRISCNFETTSELEIPLHLYCKYKPVFSIREEPTLEKPDPPVIRCRLAHTKFVTVREIQNKHISFLKRMDKEGYEAKIALLEASERAPPISATCKFKKRYNVPVRELMTPTLSPAHANCQEHSVENRDHSNNEIGTSSPFIHGPHDGISSISSHIGENDDTQEENSNKTPSTSPSGSDHPLSARKLYFPSVKRRKEDPKQNEENVTPESYWKNHPLELLKQILGTNAEDDMKHNSGRIPTVTNRSEQEIQEEVARILRGGKIEGNVRQGENNTLHSHMVLNGFSMLQFSLPIDISIFSPLFPNYPLNFGLQQTPSPFPPAFTYFSSQAGYSSPDFTSSIPHLPVVYLQYPSPMIPTPMTQPQRFGLSPFANVFPPMPQAPVYPPHQKQSNRKSRKRLFQDNTQ